MITPSTQSDGVSTARMTAKCPDRARRNMARPTALLLGAAVALSATEVEKTRYPDRGRDVPPERPSAEEPSEIIMSTDPKAVWRLLHLLPPPGPSLKRETPRLA